jgi:hypothetical protein
MGCGIPLVKSWMRDSKQKRADTLVIERRKLTFSFRSRAFSAHKVPELRKGALAGSQSKQFCPG